MTFIFYTIKLSAIVFVLSIMLFVNLFAQEKFQQSNIKISSQLLNQIKKSETSVQQKLSSDLLQLMNTKLLPEGTSLQNFVKSMTTLNQLNLKGIAVIDTLTIKRAEVYAYIYLEPGISTEILSSQNLRITDIDKKNNLVVAWIPVDNLSNLASIQEVKKIRTVIPPIINTGSVTTEGDLLHKTNQVRDLYSQSGAGIKVGIISDGVDNRSSSQATGDLPQDNSGLTVLSNLIHGDEGTAMLEIVHDMVPASELYFHDHGANEVAFNNAIDELKNAGCKVICDDIGWIEDPFFEDGMIANHINSLISGNDLIYVTSAGNDGQTHYQGYFYPLSGAPTQNDFSRGGSATPYLYINMPAGGKVRIVLQWDDKFGSSGNDYDLFLYNTSTGKSVAKSTATQSGTGDPLEVINYTSSIDQDYAIVVNKYSGMAKTLEVFVYPEDGSGIYNNNISPGDAIFGHAAVPGVLTVGAVDVTTPNTIESFSSQGPCTIAYPSPSTRAKPDIVGTDGGVITGAGSFGIWDNINWRFYGTSAAAPHAASVAAQLWGAFPTKTGVQICDVIKSKANDLGTSGFDYVFGSGLPDALNSYRDLLPPPGNPVLVSPINNETNISINCLLKWNKTLLADKYYLQVSADSLFSNCIVNDSLITDTVYSVNSLGYQTQYYWKVKAKNNKGESNWTSTWRFNTITTPSLGVPVLFSPLNNAANISVNCLLKWNKTLLADKYYVQVSTDSLFSNNIVNDSLVADTVYNVNSLGYETQYYWRIKAINLAGESYWTSPWRFTTITALPNTPYLSIPIDGAVNQPINLVIKWFKVKNADKYNLQVSLASNFTEFIINDSTITDTSKQLTLLNNKMYYWRLKGVNISGKGSWSEVRSFTTIVAVPGIPVLITPSNGAVNQLNNPKLTWSIVQDAATYRCQLSEVQEFSNLIINDSTLTLRSKGLSGLKSGMKYYWRVNAKNIAGVSDYSQTWNFITLLPSPDNLNATATVSGKVNLNWKDNSDNELGFILERNKESETDYKIIDTITANITSYIDSTVSSGIVYKYRMKAYTQYTLSNYSNESSVTPLTSIEDPNSIPKEYNLAQNFPNPFNPSTRINYQIPKEGYVTLNVYNILGSKVATLVNEFKQMGKYSIEFNASNLGSGMYIYVLRVNDYKSIKKLTLLK